MHLKDIILAHQESPKLALKYKSQKLTYQQLYLKVLGQSRKLERIDVNANIGIFLPNSIDYVIAYFTITFLDKIIVPINITAKAQEIKNVLSFCKINLILTNSEYKRRLLKKLLPEQDFISIYSIDDMSIETIGCEKGCLEKDKVEKDVALMLQTSGTTSKPKWVMLTHQGIITNVISHIQSLNLTNEEISLLALPISFSYCNTAQFLTHLYLGATLVIMDLFIPKLFFKLVEKEKITNFTGVPSLFLMMLKFKNSRSHDLSTLKWMGVGGSSISANKLRELMEMFPTVKLVKTYGQTEASPRITTLLSQDLPTKIMSVGKPIPGVTLEIFDENNHVLLANQIGEIVIKGKNIMKGYYKRSKETAQIIKEGWLYTNDLGYLDKDGFLYLVGRKKNIMISGGINICPEEIEEVLLNYPAVKECYVHGIKHDLLQEVPGAKIVLKEEFKGKCSKTDLINYCNKHLLDFKVPQMVEFVSKLPKTPSGKIIRHQKGGMDYDL